MIEQFHFFAEPERESKDSIEKNISIERPDFIADSPKLYVKFAKKVAFTMNPPEDKFINIIVRETDEKKPRKRATRNPKKDITKSDKTAVASV